MNKPMFPSVLRSLGVSLAGLVCAAAGDAGAQSVALRPAAIRSGTIGRLPAESTGFPVPYSRTLAFTTEEGTWMSVDVSPDGKRIVFDLLGDLYTLSIGGGRATRITEGPAFDAQPRFSPDGRSLIFVSDRGGADGLWVTDVNGRNPRLFVRGGHLSPVWSPDGHCVAASRRERAADGRAGRANVMLYCPESKDGLKLGPGIGATFSPDGRLVYFIARSDAWASRHGRNLTVYDRRDGRTSSYPAGARPAISPNGKALVFAVPYEGKAALRIRDLATGAERWLGVGLGLLNAADPSRDALPGYGFTPDGKALIIWIAGKLWRIDLMNGKRSPIPFTADVRLPIGELGRVDGMLIDSGSPQVRRIRSARLSPDGQRLIFVALDKLWLQDLPSGSPRRLTAGVADEYAPTWSPDGKYVAYATWGPGGGHIYRIAVGVTGSRAERLTRTPAYFDRLAYAVDGRRLLAVRGSAAERLETVRPRSRDELELVWLAAAGGEPTVILPVVRPASATFVGQPFTTRDTSRVYFTHATDGLTSVRWDGSDRRVVAKGAADDMVLSPDGRFLAVLAREIIAVLPAPSPGEQPNIDATALANPLGLMRPLARHGADELTWTADGRQLIYAGGSAWYHYEAARADSLMREARRRTNTPPAAGGPPAFTARLPDPTQQDIVVGFARDIARGTIVLRGARLITMKGHEVIERGDLVITDGRIAAVGTNLPLPANTPVVDVSGQTILPGYIDLWATFQLLPGVHAVQPWEFLAHLAYGVTTVREPGAVGPDAFDYADRVQAGEMLGPHYLVEYTVRSADAAAGEPVAMQARFGQDGGGPGLIEQVAIANRAGRQTGLLIARALRQNVFAPGSVDWTLPLTMIQDGFPIYVGTVPVTPMGNDVVQLIAHSGATYVPGLVQNDVGPWPLDRFISQGRYHDDTKLQRFVPHSILDKETLRREDWVWAGLDLFPSYAADAARIVAAGGRVAPATRGAIPGLGMHWELRALHAGGMSAHDVLRAGTIASAEALGVARNLGSLEPGKLADLQVVEGNPLTDLGRTTALTYVMKGGRLYVAATLTEVWPRQRRLLAPWWLERDPARPMTQPRSLPPPDRN